MKPQGYVVAVDALVFLGVVDASLQGHVAFLSVSVMYVIDLCLSPLGRL